MAYLKEIPVPRCPCGGRAVVTLYNHQNAPNGDYCVACGNRELAALRESEGQPPRPAAFPCCGGVDAHRVGCPKAPRRRRP